MNKTSKPASIEEILFLVGLSVFLYLFSLFVFPHLLTWGEEVEVDE